MGFSRRAGARAVGLIALGCGLLGVAAYQAASTPLGTIAVFGAAVIVAELLRRSDDELLPEPLEVERFTISAPVHVATVLVAGPWAGALVAATGVLAVRRFSGDSWRDVWTRATALALAALGGGYAFELAGGHAGRIQLPDDLFAVVVLGLVYSGVKTLLLGLAAGRLALQPEVLSSASEVGLGVALGIAALENLWIAAALVPVLLLLEQAYERLVLLRREVAAALETFANIVDERDPSTLGHSRRVAEYVSELARSLGLSRGDVARLWWAGRLHDLGKVAVDAAVLRKPEQLDEAEWAAVRRAPRLSARLLQRFRFAAQQAQAVEYHRERVDGSGYYGARGDDLPLAAHFLIVADSFDAMTTDRPFRRRRLTHEEALVELEHGSGSQFHPAIVKAFTAVRRGQDPAEVLAPEELAEIRDASVPPALTLPALRELIGERPELLALSGLTVLLLGLGTGLPEVGLAGAGAALVGLKLWSGRRLRAARLTASLEQAVAVPTDRARLFGRVVDALEEAWELDYAALVGWDEDGLGGSVELERGPEGPSDPVLISWLLREAEAARRPIVNAGGELGGDGVHLALPLRRENSALVGFLVLGGREHPPPQFEPAVRACLDGLGLAFAEAPKAVVLRPRRPFPATRERAPAPARFTHLGDTGLRNPSQGA